jgi:hypothetical protein
MEKGDGMSFAEFSYPLLQGWDWWHMFANHDVQLQVGGSDQYGNIIAGMDAIKHIAQISPESLEGKGLLDASGKLKNEVLPMGITVPLLTTASGEKFGKSAGNAIWLDKNLTSPFDLYGVSLRCLSQAYRTQSLANPVSQSSCSALPTPTLAATSPSSPSCPYPPSRAPWPPTPQIPGNASPSTSWQAKCSN